MIGATLGHRYDLVRLLGQGGMGCVYEAHDRETRARVAVKVLHGHLIDAEGDGPRRFRREAEAARAIPDDHVVRVVDSGTCDVTGRLYLVTEYLEGEDLQRLLDRTGPLAPEGAIRVACQALAGLAAAHAARVVHRDVKPANLFLARGPGGAVTVKVLDFGIAKIRPDPLGAPGAAGLTTTGNILGSPLYMAPEQVQSSRDVDPLADLWSIGSVLYAALAGRAPHQHLASVGSLLVAVCVTPAPSLAEVAPWVPAPVAEIVHRALRIRAEERWPSAAAMLDALRPFVPSGPLVEAMLVPSGHRAHSIPPSGAPSSPKVVIALDPGRPAGADEATEQLVRPERLTPSGTRLSVSESSLGLRPASPGSAPNPGTLPAGMAETPRGAGVPVVGAKAGARVVTVDPRRLLGPSCELWTLSLDVHRHMSSLIARIWKSLRRAGARLPPMTYGTAWTLVEARTGRPIAELGGEENKPLTLDAAGIRPGAVLWVVRLDGDARAQ